MIHHVLLAAPAAPESSARAFWVGVLGFEEVGKPEALAMRGGCYTADPFGNRLEFLEQAGTLRGQ